MNLIRAGQEEARFDNGIFFHNSEVKNETIVWMEPPSARPVMVFESRNNIRFHSTHAGGQDSVLCQRFD